MTARPASVTMAACTAIGAARSVPTGAGPARRRVAGPAGRARFGDLRRALPGGGGARARRRARGRPRRPAAPAADRRVHRRRRARRPVRARRRPGRRRDPPAGRAGDRAGAVRRRAQARRPRDPRHRPRRPDHRGGADRASPPRSASDSRCCSASTSRRRPTSRWRSTFSSTIIVVKLLSDRREIDELHGRIAVGILIVQDLVVIGAIIALTAIGADGGGAGVAEQAAWVRGQGGRAARRRGPGHALRADGGAAPGRPHAGAARARRRSRGRSASAALADGLGFSSEVGAFLGGVALASTPYREAIGGRLVPLRDFLLLFFFLDLGAGLDLGSLGGQLFTALVLSAFVLVAKPLIVVAVTGRLGYTSRVGFLAGVLAEPDQRVLADPRRARARPRASRRRRRRARSRPSR